MIKTYMIISSLFLLFSGTPLLAGSDTIKHLTSSNYLSTLIRSKKPVVIKFWAPWCRPCRRMNPEYQKAARSFEGNIIFAELNIDKYRDVSHIYHIRSIPTLILFKNNKIIKRSTGGMKQKDIENFIKSSL